MDEVTPVSSEKINLDRSFCWTFFLSPTLVPWQEMSAKLQCQNSDFYVVDYCNIRLLLSTLVFLIAYVRFLL